MMRASGVLVRDCFIKAGFTCTMVAPLQEESRGHLHMDMWKCLNVDDVMFDDFVLVDDSHEVVPKLTDNQISVKVSTSAAETTEAASDNQKGEDKSMRQPQMKSEDDFNMVQALKDFVLSHPTGPVGCNAFHCAHKVGDFIAANAVTVKQQEITDSFAYAHL